MKRIIFCCTWLFVMAFAVAAQTKPPVTSAVKKEMTPPEIIKEFTTRESELLEMFKEYSYKQESRLQVLGPAKIVSGEYYQLSEFVFNDAGKRIERILRAPQPTLDRAGLTMTMEDKNAFVNLQPFALTATELPNYNLSYVGKEKIDDLNTYVFDVNPKVMTDPRALNKLKDQKIEGKYFQGRIWVDDQDLQVVKVAGKTVPEFKQRFPKFETYRENIDGRYWFPTYTFGEDTLVFDDGPAIKVRLVVKYKDYRQFQSDVKITSVEGEVDEKKPEGTGETSPAAVNKAAEKPEEKKAAPQPTPAPRKKP
ncbi:MAG: hypothetical protein HOP19_23400 [Acidobacteria bacterium]|nr:hypothetical protein [Acidobacteriota bacterium]